MLISFYHHPSNSSEHNIFVLVKYNVKRGETAQTQSSQSIPIAEQKQWSHGRNTIQLSQLLNSPTGMFSVFPVQNTWGALSTH